MYASGIIVIAVRSLTGLQSRSLKANWVWVWLRGKKGVGGGETPTGIQLKYMKFYSIVKHLTGIWKLCHPNMFLFLLILPFASEKSKIPSVSTRALHGYHHVGPTESVRLVAISSFTRWLKYVQIQALSPSKALWSRGEGGNRAQPWQGIGSGCCHGNLLLSEIPV